MEKRVGIKQGVLILVALTALVLFFNYGKFGVLPSPTEQPWLIHYIDRHGNNAIGADGTDLKDIDNDSNLDVASGWEESGDVRVYLNPGNKSAWKIKQACETCKEAEDSHLVDIDNDGIYEVISARSNILTISIPRDNSLDLWDNYNFQINKARWMAIDSGNIDDKNGIDIFVGSKSEYSLEEPGIYWLESPTNPKNISSWKEHKIANSNWIMGIIARDMDKDGDLDVLVSDRPKKISWFENPGNESRNLLWKEYKIGATCEARWLRVSDLDSDGISDVVVADSCSGTAVTWFKGKVNSKEVPWQAYKIGFLSGGGTDSSKSVDIGDINKDRKKDILVATHGSYVYWLSYNNSVYDSKWTWHVIYDAGGTKFDESHLVDVDKDNDLDVITSDEYKLGVVWFENALPEPPFQICDEDNDSFSDISCGGNDCNDNNQEINPNIIERCNNIDDNCNNQIDENIEESCGDEVCAGVRTCNNGVFSECRFEERIIDDCLRCDSSGNLVNLPDRTECDDDLYCTENDVCFQGECVGVEKVCGNDNIECTIPFCSEIQKNCVFDTSLCDCILNSDCPDDNNLCTDSKCENGRCVISDNTADCNDNTACTENDKCDDGECRGTIKSCDDNIECSLDSCANGFCQHDYSDCSCNSNSECNDNNICSVDLCVNRSCEYEFNNVPCNDNNLCTLNDSCSQGVCYGELKNCNDKISCSIDSCRNGNCLHDFDDCQCDNDEDCNDNNICTDNYCNMTTRKCFKIYNSKKCNDNNDNTLNDICREGGCIGENICNLNSKCEWTRGENCENCPDDCGACLTISTTGKKYTPSSNAPVVSSKLTVNFWIALVLGILVVIMVSIILHMLLKDLIKEKFAKMQKS